MNECSPSLIQHWGPRLIEKNPPQPLPRKHSLTRRGMKWNPLTLKSGLLEVLPKFCGAAAEVAGEDFTEGGIWAKCLWKKREARGWRHEGSVWCGSRVWGNSPCWLVSIDGGRVGRELCVAAEFHCRRTSEIIILSQTEKDKYHMISLICGI